MKTEVVGSWAYCVLFQFYTNYRSKMENLKFTCKVPPGKKVRYFVTDTEVYLLKQNYNSLYNTMANITGNGFWSNSFINRLLFTKPWR